jgi:hypothetical protein
MQQPVTTISTLLYGFMAKAGAIPAKSPRCIQRASTLYHCQSLPHCAVFASTCHYISANKLSHGKL